MRKLIAGVLLAAAALALYGQESPEKDKKSGWPKSLADGPRSAWIPASTCAYGVRFRETLGRLRG